MRNIQTLGALTFILIATACATAQNTPPTIDVESFTTQGKPTKTIQTPWGDKQVYDPIQDAEVIAAYEYVERIHKRYGPDKKYNELKTYEVLFNNIRRIQYYDKARLGCQFIKQPGCGSILGEVFTENNISEQCQVLDFGKSTLNACEERNSKKEEDFTISLSTSPNCRVDFENIGQSVLVKEEHFEAYFHSTCQWSKNIGKQ